MKQYYDSNGNEILDEDEIRRIEGDGYSFSFAQDQSIKADAGKEKLTLVPRQIIKDIARVREFGSEKYKDPESWKRVEIGRYRDAAFRHWLRYLDDPHGMDDESGLPHLWHVACNIAFLCELEDFDNVGK